MHSCAFWRNPRVLRKTTVRHFLMSGGHKNCQANEWRYNNNSEGTCDFSKIWTLSELQIKYKRNCYIFLDASMKDARICNVCRNSQYCDLCISNIFFRFRRLVKISILKNTPIHINNFNKLLIKFWCNNVIKSVRS